MDALRGVSGVCGVPGVYGGECGVRGGLPGVSDILCSCSFFRCRTTREPSKVPCLQSRSDLLSQCQLRHTLTVNINELIP